MQHHNAVRYSDQRNPGQPLAPARGLRRHGGHRHAPFGMGNPNGLLRVLADRLEHDESGPIDIAISVSPTE
jgi:hypothetical protein